MIQNFIHTEIRTEKEDKAKCKRVTYRVTKLDENMNIFDTHEDKRLAINDIEQIMKDIKKRRRRKLYENDRKIQQKTGKIW